MNPVRIMLRDFGSYVNEDIDLTDVHVAVLLGDNGSGKTTLIEAIPWALYGQGSKGGKRGAMNYVRHGAESCSVSLYFRQGDTTYIVQREYLLDKGRTMLALLVLDTESGEVEDISHKNITDTQAMIVSIIGMDYNAFVASVFALQGQSASLASDALTDQERKEILSSILGLAIWDQVLINARERLRDAQNRKSSLAGSADILEQQAASLESLQDELHIHRAVISALEDEVEERQGTRDKAAATYSVAKAKIDGLNMVSLKEEMSGFRATLQTIEDDIERAQSDEVSQVARLEGVIFSLRATLEENVSKLERMRAIACDANMDMENIEEELNVTVESLDFLNAQQAQRAELQKQLLLAERCAAKAASRRERNLANLTAQLDRAKQDAALLDKVPCSADMHAGCQLLQQALAAAQTIGNLQSRVDAIFGEVLPEEEQAQRLAAEFERYPDVSQELSVLSARQKELTDMVCLFADISKLELRIESDERQTVQLQDQIASCHDNTQRVLEQLLERHETIEGKLAEIAFKLEGVGDAVEAADSSAKCLHEAEVMLRDSRSKLSEATAIAGSLQRAFDDALTAQQALVDLRMQLEKTTHEIFVLELIERAAGKRSGVPALIMENSLPFIERLANDTRAEMSDGRFEVRFETQLTSKAGTQQDVLRLYIYDGPEPRPYATYSGAERFMVDLAMRIAMAKFLSELSGSDVRMLVLDEGLSVLDNANRLEATQALLAASRSFDKLLVVTHIAELQDMFEQRIIVEKTVHGSHAHIR